MADLNLNGYVVVIGIIVAYFITSMFMYELPLVILTLPFTFPLIVSLGFDPIWFGVMTIMMVIMGLIFPPIGMIAFVVSAVTKVDLVKVYQGATVLLVGVVLTTALVIIFPKSRPGYRRKPANGKMAGRGTACAGGT